MKYKAPKEIKTLFGGKKTQANTHKKKTTGWEQWVKPPLSISVNYSVCSYRLDVLCS